jgi:hypothetical protein
MDVGRFNFRGVRIGIVGVAVAMIGIGVGDYIPGWLVFAMALAGIGIGWLGAVIHWMDMVRQRRAEAEARKAWIRQHGDPNRRDDPADRVKEL